MLLKNNRIKRISHFHINIIATMNDPTLLCTWPVCRSCYKGIIILSFTVNCQSVVVKRK